MSVLTQMSPSAIRSPLKWAGGKYRLLGEIAALLPVGNRLIEPFVGSGAVFLNLPFKRYTINDKNQDLVSFYQILKREQATFIHYCQRFFRPASNEASVYYQCREEFNTTSNKKRKAALFLYLNRHGYNGLCRYNQAGKLNVPFGHYKKTYFPEQEMQHFLRKSHRIAIQAKDFESLMLQARPGDVIYCDPPYVPLSQTASFTGYNAGGFDEAEHVRLCEVAEAVCGAGVTVLISNHSTVFTKALYRHAHLKKDIPVKRSINCCGERRRHPVKEILALYQAQ